MHPILAQIRRLAMYLVGWIPVAILLAYLLAASTGIPKMAALILAAPLCLAYAFMCLSAWYVCLGSPLGRHSLSRIVVGQALAALVATGLWILAARVLTIELA